MAIVPRFGLALVNTEANDNHMEVVSLILDRGIQPKATDCWECYQPKLFHQSTAWLIGALDLTSARSRIVAAQMLNATAGALTVVLLWLLALRLEIAGPSRLLAFALIVLNPRFIAINGQATNDSFVILFGTIAISGFLSLLDHHRFLSILTTTAALILASLSKVQGVALFAIMTAILVIRGVCSPYTRRFHLWAAALVAIAYLATVPFLGPYWSHYVTTGTPFPSALDAPSVPPPAWFEKSEVGRPGVRSVADAYLTFRLFDLLREPFIRGRGYAEHRTSLWSQLYARSQFSRFEGWPPTWRTKNAGVLFLGRSALLLGLVPLFMLLVGMGGDIADLGNGVRHQGLQFIARDSKWVSTVLACGMLLLVAKYSYDQRDFTTMKAIFVYPGIAAFMITLVRGMARCLRWFEDISAARISVFSALVLLIAVYTADVWVLVANLWSLGAAL